MVFITPHNNKKENIHTSNVTPLPPLSRCHKPFSHPENACDRGVFTVTMTVVTLACSPHQHGRYVRTASFWGGVWVRFTLPIIREPPVTFSKNDR